MPLITVEPVMLTKDELVEVEVPNVNDELCSNVIVLDCSWTLPRLTVEAVSMTVTCWSIDDAKLTTDDTTDMAVKWNVIGGDELIVGPVDKVEPPVTVIVEGLLVASGCTRLSVDSSCMVRLVRAGMSDGAWMTTMDCDMNRVTADRWTN